MLRARARGSAAGEGSLRLRTGRCVYPRMLLNLFDAGVGLALCSPDLKHHIYMSTEDTLLNAVQWSKIQDEM